MPNPFMQGFAKPSEITTAQRTQIATAARRQPVATIAALKALTPSAGDAVNVLGYAAAGDGGSGTFYYDSASVAADNGGTVIEPDAGGGRWIRQFSGPVDVRWFGARKDGTSASAAFTAANAAATGRGLLVSPGGTGAFNLDTSVTFTTHVVPDGWRRDVTQAAAVDYVQTYSYALDGAATVTRPRQVGEQRATSGMSSDVTYPSRDQWASFAVFHKTNGTFDLVHHVNPHGHSALWKYRGTTLTIEFYSDMVLEVRVTNFPTLDAALAAYRSWASQQEFVIRARRKPLDYHFAGVCSTNTASYATGTYLPALAELKGGRALVWFTQYRTNAFDAVYPDYTPAAGFQTAMDAFLATGHSVAPYINGLLWDTAEPSYPIAEMAVDATLTPIAYNATTLHFACPGSDVFKRRLVAEADKVKADAIYLDMLWAIAPRRCYDRTGRHGHVGVTPGAWLAGLKSITSLFADRVIASEGFNEQGLPFVDIWFEVLGGTVTSPWPVLATIYGDVATVAGWKNLSSTEATKLAEITAARETYGRSLFGGLVSMTDDTETFSQTTVRDYVLGAPTPTWRGVLPRPKAVSTQPAFGEDVFAAADATPSVRSRKRNYKTANTADIVITAFDDSIRGQEWLVTVVNTGTTTIDCTGTNLISTSGADLTPSSGDVLRCTNLNGTKILVELIDLTP